MASPHTHVSVSAFALILIVGLCARTALAQPLVSVTPSGRDVAVTGPLDSAVTIPCQGGLSLGECLDNHAVNLTAELALGMPSDVQDLPRVGDSWVYRSTLIEYEYVLDGHGASTLQEVCSTLQCLELSVVAVGLPLFAGRWVPVGEPIPAPVHDLDGVYYSPAALAAHAVVLVTSDVAAAVTGHSLSSNGLCFALWFEDMVVVNITYLSGPSYVSPAFRDDCPTSNCTCAHKWWLCTPPSVSLGGMTGEYTLDVEWHVESSSVSTENSVVSVMVKPGAAFHIPRFGVVTGSGGGPASLNTTVPPDVEFLVPSLLTLNSTTPALLFQSNTRITARLALNSYDVSQPNATATPSAESPMLGSVLVCFATNASASGLPPTVCPAPEEAPANMTVVVLYNGTDVVSNSEWDFVYESFNSALFSFSTTPLGQARRMVTITARGIDLVVPGSPRSSSGDAHSITTASATVTVVPWPLECWQSGSSNWWSSSSSYSYWTSAYPSSYTAYTYSTSTAYSSGTTSAAASTTTAYATAYSTTYTTTYSTTAAYSGTTSSRESGHAAGDMAKTHAEEAEDKRVLRVVLIVVGVLAVGGVVGVVVTKNLSSRRKRKRGSDRGSGSGGGRYGVSRVDSISHHYLMGAGGSPGSPSSAGYGDGSGGGGGGGLVFRPDLDDVFVAHCRCTRCKRAVSSLKTRVAFDALYTREAGGSIVRSTADCPDYHELKTVWRSGLLSGSILVSAIEVDFVIDHLRRLESLPAANVAALVPPALPIPVNELSVLDVVIMRLYARASPSVQAIAQQFSLAEWQPSDRRPSLTATPDCACCHCAPTAGSIWCMCCLDYGAADRYNMCRHFTTAHYSLSEFNPGEPIQAGKYKASLLPPEFRNDKQLMLARNHSNSLSVTDVAGCLRGIATKKLTSFLSDSVAELLEFYLRWETAMASTSPDSLSALILQAEKVFLSWDTTSTRQEEVLVHLLPSGREDLLSVLTSGSVGVYNRNLEKLGERPIYRDKSAGEPHSKRRRNNDGRAAGDGDECGSLSASASESLSTTSVSNSNSTSMSFGANFVGEFAVGDPFDVDPRGLGGINGPAFPVGGFPEPAVFSTAMVGLPSSTSIFSASRGTPAGRGGGAGAVNGSGGGGVWTTTTTTATAAGAAVGTRAGEVPSRAGQPHSAAVPIEGVHGAQRTTSSTSAASAASAVSASSPPFYAEGHDPLTLSANVELATVARPDSHSPPTATLSSSRSPPAFAHASAVQSSGEPGHYDGGHSSEPVTLQISTASVLCDYDNPLLSGLSQASSSSNHTASHSNLVSNGHTASHSNLVSNGHGIGPSHCVGSSSSNSNMSALPGNGAVGSHLPHRSRRSSSPELLTPVDSPARVASLSPGAQGSTVQDQRAGLTTTSVSVGTGNSADDGQSLRPHNRSPPTDTPSPMGYVLPIDAPSVGGSGNATAGHQRLSGGSSGSGAGGEGAARSPSSENMVVPHYSGTTSTSSREASGLSSAQASRSPSFLPLTPTDVPVSPPLSSSLSPSGTGGLDGDQAQAGASPPHEQYRASASPLHSSASPSVVPASPHGGLGVPGGHGGSATTTTSSSALSVEDSSGNVANGLAAAYAGGSAGGASGGSTASVGGDYPVLGMLGETAGSKSSYTPLTLEPSDSLPPSNLLSGAGDGSVPDDYGQGQLDIADIDIDSFFA